MGTATRAITSGIRAAARQVRAGLGTARRAVRRLRSRAVAAPENLADHLEDVAQATTHRRNAVRFEGRAGPPPKVLR
jgi:hypothetical protein